MTMNGRPIKANDIEQATGIAMRSVARGVVPGPAIDNYVAGLKAILAYYAGPEATRRPTDEEMRAAQIALAHALSDRLVAEKLTAFGGALAVVIDAPMSQQMAFDASVIQGNLIDRFQKSA